MRFVQLSPLPLAILILAGSTMRLGAECGLIPYTPTRAQNSAAESAAREHLKKSIGHYEAALAIDRGNLLARLGYGWVLDQAGEKTRAIVEYRQVIKDTVEQGRTDTILRRWRSVFHRRNRRVPDSPSGSES